MISILDLATIGVYFLFLLVIGIISYRKVKNENDFALAGRNLGYPTLISTITATAIGAGATLGVGGLSYNMGIVVLWSVIAYALGLIGFSLIAGVIRRIEVWTIPEVLYKRYGNTTRIICTFFLIFGIIALFGVQVAALGTVFSAVGNVYGITYSWAVVIAGTVMVAYTFAGGMYAIAYTEMLQALLLLIALGVLLPFFVFSDLPLGQMTEQLPSNMLDFWTGAPWHVIVGWFLTLIPICFIDVSLWQRASSGRDEKVVKKSILISALLYFGYSVAIILVGMAGLILFPDLVSNFGTSDVVIPLAITSQLPTFVVGLALAAILAVIMSTAASILMVAGVTVSRDVARIFSPDLSEKKGLLVARGSVILIGVLGMAFALLMKGIFDMMMLAFALFVSGAFIPTMAALFWDKATNKGAVSSMVGGMIMVTLLYALNKPYNIEPIFGALVVSFLLMVLVSLATYKPGETTPALSSLED